MCAPARSRVPPTRAMIAANRNHGDSAMTSETPAAPARADFPYETHLDIRYAQGEVIDVPALVAAVTHPWWNQTLCRVNESVVRLGVVQGEYHWHKHDDEDEFF